MRTASRALLLLMALALSSGIAQAQSKARGKAAVPSDATPQAGAAASPKPSGKLDINTASKEELSALPGVGPVTAQKIIDGRPYRAKNDLVSRRIIGEKEYAKIKDQIIAHRVKGETAKAGGKKRKTP